MKPDVRFRFDEHSDTQRPYETLGVERADGGLLLDPVSNGVASDGVLRQQS